VGSGEEVEVEGDKNDKPKMMCNHGTIFVMSHHLLATCPILTSTHSLGPSWNLSEVEEFEVKEIEGSCC